MLKKLWQKLTGKAKARKDDKREDHRQEDDESREDTARSPHFLKPDRTAGWFYFVAALCLASVVTWESFKVVTLDNNGWMASGLKTVAEVLSHSGQAAAAVVLWSALIGEIGRLVVVLAQKIARESKLKVKRVQDKLREEGRAEVLADLEAARAKTDAERARADAERARADEQQAAIVGWYARMQAAQEKGEPFDEPPPLPRRDNGASES